MTKTKADRQLLVSIAKEASSLLHEELGANMFLRHHGVTIDKVNTDGWVASLGGLQGENGAKLEIWLDDWTRTTTRRFCFCLAARHDSYVSKVVNRLKTEFGKIKILRDEDWSKDNNGICRLIKPLSKSLFDTPIAELYYHFGSWSYISFYHSMPPTASSRKCVVQDGVSFLAQLAQALVGTRAKKVTRDFPAEINRKYVRFHVARERSSAAANFAKDRDAYTCRVCNFNFSTVYGELGAGFAEAHHVLPLASAKPYSRTNPDDIITVCANCHRMLHRLEGRKKDAERLRRIIQKG